MIYYAWKFIAVTVAIAWNCSGACGQMKFYDALSRIEDNRSRLLSYVASYQQIVYGSETSSLEGSESTTVLQLRKGSVIADLTTDFSLTTIWKSPISYKYPRQRVNLLFLKQKHKFFMLQGSRLREISQARSELFLNPGVVGLCFCPELRTFTNFEEILGSYRSHTPHKQIKQLDDGLIEFSTANSAIVVDTAKACLPVSVSVSYGKNQGFTIKTVYVEKDGVWLPSASHYSCGPLSNRFDIEWHSVNQPVPEEVFDQLFISQVTGLQPSPAAWEISGAGEN